MADKEIGTLTYKLELKDAEKVMEKVNEARKILWEVDAMLDALDKSIQATKGKDDE